MLLLLSITIYVVYNINWITWLNWIHTVQHYSWHSRAVTGDTVILLCLLHASYCYKYYKSNCLCMMWWINKINKINKYVLTYSMCVNQHMSCIYIDICHVCILTCVMRGYWYISCMCTNICHVFIRPYVTYLYWYKNYYVVYVYQNMPCNYIDIRHYGER